MVIIIKNQSDLFERFISEPSDNRQLTYLPCVAVATTSYGSSDHSSDQCHLTSSSWRWSRRSFHVPWTTELTFLWHLGRSDEQVAVCTECSCAVGFWRSMLWPYNAGATGAALSSSSASDGFQDSHPGLFVTARHSSSIPGRRLSAGLWWRSSSAAFCQLKDMCCQTDLQQLWREMLCCCRFEAVEQSASSSETNWHKLKQFKRVLKTFLFGCWECGAFWLTVKLRPLSHLTYLLTYLLTLLWLSVWNVWT